MYDIIKNGKTKLKNTKASLLIEATLVYPIMLFVLLVLMYMGNMFYLNAKINSIVSREALAYSQRFADPNFETFQNGVPTSSKGSTELTGELYRYIDIFNLGDYGVASNAVKDELAQKIENTGFYAGMVPANVTVTTHRVHNYVVYQTYEVEVNYQLKLPVKFMFTGNPMLLNLTARDECPIVDTSEFIRNVDMAVDYFERTEPGENLQAKLKESYERIDQFINGPKRDPSEAVAGGVPGMPPLTTEGLRDEFGYDIPQDYIDSHKYLYMEYFRLKANGMTKEEINENMLRDYCAQLYAEDAASRGKQKIDDIDKISKEIEKASERAIDVDPTMTKNEYYFIKNGLIPYEPEKQFPNAYKEWNETFSNTDTFGCVQTQWSYDSIHDNHPNAKDNFGYAMGRDNPSQLPNGELFVCEYYDLKSTCNSTDSKVELATKLGFDDDYFDYGGGGYLVRIDDSVVKSYTYSEPSFLGSNYYWAPGMRTSGGQYEAVINRIENIDECEVREEVEFTKLDLK